MAFVDSPHGEDAEGRELHRTCHECQRDCESVIASATGQSQAAGSGVLEALFSTVSDAVAKGSKVSIPGWISFEQTATRRHARFATRRPASRSRSRPVSASR
jgi:nucleoid DNA-binding protein